MSIRDVTRIPRNEIFPYIYHPRPTQRQLVKVTAVTITTDILAYNIIFNVFVAIYMDVMDQLQNLIVHMNVTLTAHKSVEAVTGTQFMK